MSDAASDGRLTSPGVEQQASLFGPDEGHGYRHGRVWDEMVTGDGRLRAHWLGLMGRLAPLDPAHMAERLDGARRLMHQNGVTYTVYGDGGAAERPWPLDVVPLILPNEEWRHIEAGAIQRARLLNAVLGDIYGAQTAVSRGLLPATLLHADSRFLRACVGLTPPRGVHLHLSAIDLARAPDGRWWVLSDRTQAPSGAGYALENRGVLGRVMADCLADAPVRPLAPFFAALLDNLKSLAPSTLAGRAPRLVLLTPGPYNETYFEHAFLARQLGISLVEGADLVVRDRRVYLKTLSGLEPVDVILRRMDDDFCDPLELRPDSWLGIAGLVEAARAGTVAIANALGSGILEGKAFKPFFPGLARAFLGEELILPDVASWWCGGDAERDFVQANLDQLVLKPAFPGSGHVSQFGADLNAADRARIAARVAARPAAFVGHERVALSTVPVWLDGGLQPRPLVLRVFVAATPDGFTVMPGGLARTAPTLGTSVVTMQRGGGCKDTWVLGGGEGRRVDRPNDARSTAPVEAPHRNVGIRVASDGALPSRAADGLFWTGRYAERLDGHARLLRTLLLGMTDATQAWTMRDAAPIMTLAIWTQLLPMLDFGKGERAAPGLLAMLHAAFADPAHPSGVVATRNRLVHAASGVRDRLPADCWRVIAAIDQPLDEATGGDSKTEAKSAAAFDGAFRLAPARLLLRLDRLITLNAAFVGAVAETMPRDASWRFLDMGRRLERAMTLVETVRRVADHGPDDPTGPRDGEQHVLAAIQALTGARPVSPNMLSTTVTEHGAVTSPTGGRRARVGAHGLDRAAILTAALLAPGDPRGLAFQLGALVEHLGNLPRPDQALGAVSDQASPDLAAAIARDALASLPEVIKTACGPGEGDEDPMVAAFEPMARALPELSDLLAFAYFSHALSRPA